MIIGISAAAEADIAEGYWFYERQSAGLGDLTPFIRRARALPVLNTEKSSLTSEQLIAD